jgi:hypothetical protein
MCQCRSSYDVHGLVACGASLARLSCRHCDGQDMHETRDQSRTGLHIRPSDAGHRQYRGVACEDQTVLSESLDIQPPARLRSDKTPCGDRSIRASLSGEVAIRYQAVVENNLRQMLPTAGHQHLWSELPNDVLPFLLPSRFCPSDKFMRFAQREFGGSGDGVTRVMAILEWIHRNVDYVSGVSNAETTAERTFV